MNLDVKVFDRKVMKRLFYYFVSYNILIGLLSSWLHINGISHFATSSFFTANSMLVFAVLLVVTIGFSIDLKKRLLLIRKQSQPEQQFAEYENYYRRRLIWNCFSVSISGLLLVLTHKNWFLYLLIVEVIMSLSAYPSKNLIQTDLKDSEILVT